jgi:hypothetical protein
LSFNWLDSGFLGALAGSLLTGIVAIIVMTRQISYDKKKETTKGLSDYIKSFKKIEIYAGSILKGAEDLAGLMKESLYEREKQDILFHFNLVLGDIKSYRDEIKFINEDYIPEEIYDKFILLKQNIDDVVYYTSRFINNEADTLDPLEDVIRRLDVNLQIFTKYTEPKITELKKLKK